MIYGLIKGLVRGALFCYFREVRFEGLDRIPRERPVMFLPNHQNALLDALLLAAFIPGMRPYFLTRSDVFRGPLLRRVFEGFRMMPVYRLRDGRETLGRNQAIFERSASLLHRGEPLLLFPEANHNLKRQVRPLSKGFTRIVFKVLSEYPQTDLQLVPVGINYQCAAGFPDRVAYYFGRTVAAAPFLEGRDESGASRALIHTVSGELARLTTHLPEGDDYASRLAALEALHPDYLQPGPINRYLAGEIGTVPTWEPRKGFLFRAWDVFFKVVNLPMMLPWRWGLAPRVPEPEFQSTYRFAFALMAFPVYYLLLGLVLYAWVGAGAGVLGATALFLHNLLYVKRR